MDYISAPPVHHILCADCGTAILPNSVNLCLSCVRNTIDITEGIPKQASISFCRNCERFLSPPQVWLPVKPESAELLSICLRRLKGLNKVRLTDAHFIWTEPHSKRLRVSITIQKEVLTHAVLEQTFEIEYLVNHCQCQDCMKIAAKNMWSALVQVRQKVSHKRTFLFLEQLILKLGAQKDILKVKEVKHGLDFYFGSRVHAVKMVDFLQGVVPVRLKSSERIISSDNHSNVANFKFTYSVEIIPICKDDLICIPHKQARKYGNISPLTLCSRVGNSLQLLDANSLQTCEISSNLYWRCPFHTLATVTDLVEFTVLNIEPHGRSKGKLLMADALVALADAFRSGWKYRYHDEDRDMVDRSPAIYHTRTHLGAILHPGDTVMGYYLAHRNFNSDDFASLDPTRVPDIILVKKSYPNQRKKNKMRIWKLRSIPKEISGDMKSSSSREVVGRLSGGDHKKLDEDYELFLRDIEEDSELRASINLYKLTDRVPKSDRGSKKGNQYAMDIDHVQLDSKGTEPSESDEETDFPNITLDELLDDFDKMTLANRDGIYD